MKFGRYRYILLNIVSNLHSLICMLLLKCERDVNCFGVFHQFSQCNTLVRVAINVATLMYQTHSSLSSESREVEQRPNVNVVVALLPEGLSIKIGKHGEGLGVDFRRRKLSLNKELYDLNLLSI